MKRRTLTKTFEGVLIQIEATIEDDVIVVEHINPLSLNGWNIIADRWHSKGETIYEAVADLIEPGDFDE